MRDFSLPKEFETLKVSYVQRVSSDEYSSSCPQCGGEPHKGGELPDRFRMFLNASGKNKVMGWCRRCSYVWFPDTRRAISPEEMERWRKEQLEREEARKRSAEKAISALHSEKIWLKFNEALNAYSLDVLRSWGIREDWARFWRLGLLCDHIVKSNEGEYHSPAISIPMWQQDSPAPANIKLRILNPKNSGDRYRSFYKTGIATDFTAFNKLKSDTVVLVEGEKKAMVVAQWSDQKYQVVGLPSVTPNGELLAKYDKYGKIIVCLDPDAKIEDKNGHSPLKRLVKAIGREVAWVDLPDKVDDMILRGMRFDNALKYAKALEVK